MKYSIKTRKCLLVTGYRIFFKSPKLEILSHLLPHSLTTVASLEPKRVVNGHHFTPQQQTHWWDVPFGVLMGVRPVHLVFPFIFNQVDCLLF